MPPAAAPAAAPLQKQVEEGLRLKEHRAALIRADDAADKGHKAERQAEKRAAQRAVAGRPDHDRHQHKRDGDPAEGDRPGQQLQNDDDCSQQRRADHAM